MFLDKKVFYYPPCHRGGYGNPYSLNYKKALAKYCHLLDAENKVSKMQSLTLLRYSFLSDVVILNWPETIIFNRLGWVQYLLLMMALLICKLRGCCMVWMFHNIHPHEGENFYTRSVQNYLFRNAYLIVGHSREACEYAKKVTNSQVAYACHPVESFGIRHENHRREKLYDVLIWGTIYPYKGIAEFISNKSIRESGMNIHIVGKATESELSAQIHSLCNDKITFDERRTDFLELSQMINRSRHVLFPYIGNSISSSGAMIDTIVMGGTPVGPAIGAFKDLESEGVCLTYSNMNECLDILKSDKTISEENRQSFMDSNTWNSFAEKLIGIIDSEL